MKLTINSELQKAVFIEVERLKIENPEESEEILYDRAALHLAKTHPELFSPLNMMESMYLSMVEHDKR